MIPISTILLLSAVLGVALAIDVALLILKFKGNLDETGTPGEAVDFPPKLSRRL